ncbi:Protein Y41D4A.5 [Aphelenchoides avenae]|nr:Protein Y41D4A.5 [Aphelenchus avenae]
MESPQNGKTIETIMHEYLDKYEKEEQNGFKLLNFEFLDIRKEQASFQSEGDYSFSTGQKLEHYMRNRYRDILPYDNNRVILKDATDPDGYINASPIVHPQTPTQYIASQAPLSSTVNDFWQMIVQHGVKIIGMLCKTWENDMPKCEHYWPSEVGEKRTFGPVSVTHVEEQTFEDYIWRKFQVTDENFDAIVHQLNYTEWPDHGCPDGEKNILEFIELMNRLHEDDRKSPILLHCSAGCGRTGTVIAANIIRELIKAKKLTKIDVKQLVLELRRQRGSMVQTPGQYQLLHKCIAHYCRQALGKASIAEPAELAPGAECTADNPDSHESDPSKVTAAVLEESISSKLNGKGDGSNGPVKDVIDAEPEQIRL